MPFIDWGQLIAAGLISSLISASLGLGSWILARKWLRRKIYDEISTYIMAQITYFQQNPDQFSNMVAPFLSALAKSAEKEAAGGQSFSLGPLNRIVPKQIRPLLLQWLIDKFAKSTGLPKEVAEVAKQGENPFK